MNVIVRLPHLTDQLEWYTNNNDLFEEKKIDVALDMLSRPGYIQIQYGFADGLAGA